MKTIRPPSALEWQFLKDRGVTPDMDVVIFQDLPTETEKTPDAWAILVKADGNMTRQVLTWKSLEKMRAG